MNFQKLINTVNTSPLSNDILQQMTLLFKHKMDQSSIISEHKTCQILSQDSHALFNHSCYLDFFQTFALFNKQIVFEQETISFDIKTLI
ncbi:unnamed protein product [Adineta steineri]|uniref:Uncharacterized protein n=1 Tax=Adineta steineri TaxID=433720 RepID=A0A819R8X2_9BILA|nr:unnamed protein product [Adineta steineri]CAF1512455.1 unnamed protein product [Adineta steineri]CAF3810461.1 unnamed protein product [Adineta steineri]CAF4040515.1 unnamed protein product [Adineta steineri]